MDLATLIRGGILVSMLLLVASLGMRSAAGDVLYLLKRRSLLVRSVFSINFALPLLTIFVVPLFDLRPEVKMALVALSLSPVPPFLPDKQLRLEHNRGYVYALFVTASLVSIVLIPVAMELLSARVPSGRHVGPGRVLNVVATTVLVPLTTGAVVRLLWPAAAIRLSGLLSKVGGILLLIALVPVLFAQWPSVRELLGDGTLLAIVVFVGVGLLIGHWLGGPDPDDRSVLALATSSRHPAVALAITSVSFPDQKLVPAAILLALIVGMIASAPYSAWRKRVHAASFGPSPG